MSSERAGSVQHPGLERLYERLGAAMKSYRKAHGFSQSEFGEMCGLSRSHVNRIEHGHTAPSLPALNAIAEAMGTNILELLALAEIEASRGVDVTHHLAGYDFEKGRLARYSRLWQFVGDGDPTLVLVVNAGARVFVKEQEL